MAKTDQLGIFWGNEALYFVETAGTDAKKAFHVPFAKETEEGIKKGPSGSGEAKLVSNIKDTLFKHNITITQANLSLSTRDIIFRSFVIPWMQQHEIESVVEFEIGKYIPFSIEELSFSFQSIIITENNIKHIRIIVAAIKKDALENHLKILEMASLQINLIEPSASSLIRTLSFKDIIPQDQTIAIIEKEDVGRILVVNDNIPQFVREFYLSPSPEGQEGEALEEAMKKMPKEVRISLDYFNRQNDQLQVKKLFLLTAQYQENIAEDLEKYLSMPVTAIDSQSILKDTSQIGTGILNAYGASIVQSVDSPHIFDLSGQTAKSSKLPKMSLEKKPINYRALFITVLICVPLIVIPIIASGILKQKMKTEINTLNQKLDSFKDADISMIDQKETILNSKLTYLKNTRSHSNIAVYLILIADLLPEGTWVKEINIQYDDSPVFSSATVDKSKKTSKARKPAVDPTLTVTIEGYAYSENENKQFGLVQKLLQNLKESKEFSGFFPNIDLGPTKSQKLNEYTATFFNVVCKRNYEIK